MLIPSIQAWSCSRFGAVDWRVEPTTVTTIVMVVFALALLSYTVWTWFGSWQPEPRRLSPERRLEDEYERAVREMREAIERYERGERPL